MPVKESAIEFATVPDHLAPLRGEPSAAAAPLAPGTGYGKPLPRAEQGPALPRQFAFLLAEVLAGMRPERQMAPWLTKRATLHLHRLLPLLNTGHQPRVLRVRATRPAPNVVEMTMIAVIGTRHRAVAVRLEHSTQLARWQCTDIESA